MNMFAGLCNLLSNVIPGKLAGLISDGGDQPSTAPPERFLPELTQAEEHAATTAAAARLPEPPLPNAAEVTNSKQLEVPGREQPRATSEPASAVATPKVDLKAFSLQVSVLPKNERSPAGSATPATLSNPAMPAPPANVSAPQLQPSSPAPAAPIIAANSAPMDDRGYSSAPAVVKAAAPEPQVLSQPVQPAPAQPVNQGQPAPLAASAEQGTGQSGKQSACSDSRQSKQEKDDPSKHSERVEKGKTGSGFVTTQRPDSSLPSARGVEVRTLLQRIEGALDQMQSSRLQQVQMKINLSSGETVRILLSLRGESLRTVILTESESLRVALREGWDGLSRALSLKGVQAETPRFSMAFHQDQGRSSQDNMEQRAQLEQNIYAARSRPRVAAASALEQAASAPVGNARGHLNRFA